MKVYKMAVRAPHDTSRAADGMSIRQAMRVRSGAENDSRMFAVFVVAAAKRERKPAQRPKPGPWLDIIDQIRVD
jgi:hypothetical protein